MNLIENIMECYAALGKRPASFNKKFSFYVLPRWRNPVMSPIYLREKKILNQKDLQTLEFYFKKNKAMNVHDTSTPYFQTLVAARQMISAQYGVKLWITTTSNSRIARKADGYYKILTFQKCEMK